MTTSHAYPGFDKEITFIKGSQRQVPGSPIYPWHKTWNYHAYFGIHIFITRLFHPPVNGIWT